MSVRSAQSVTVVFTTRRFDTGAATNGDSTPTGTIYVNGTADAASVTVTNITTGVYKAAVTLPTLSAGDEVDLRISATVNSVTDNGVVWHDTKDLALDSSFRPGIDWSNVGAPTTTVGLSGTTISTGQTITSVSGSVGSISGITFPTNFSAIAITAGGIVQADLQTIKTQSVTCSGGVTIPAATLASTTNITAATGITVSTNNDKTGYSLTQAFPSNFSSMSITAGGIVKADLQTILATAVTEGGAGRLGAGFTKLFDVASPVLTAASVNQTGDSYARIGANGVSLSAIPDEAGVTTLLSRLSSARAGYLDNINNSNLANVPAFPSNFASLAITAGGIAKADLQTILATAVTEGGAGRLGAGFTKLFDVASPVLTAASVNQTGDSYARIGANGVSLSAIPDEAGVTTLLARLTSTRAGYLDNLSGGAVALASGVTVTTNNDKTGYSLTSAYDFAKGTVAVTESYAAAGAAPTPVQALLLIQQSLHEFGIVSTTRTVKKLDGSTTAATFTLNSATVPTSTTRAT